MILPAEKTKNPNTHPMIRITATRYNKLLIKLFTNKKTIAIPKDSSHDDNSCSGKKAVDELLIVYY